VGQLGGRACRILAPRRSEPRFSKALFHIPFCGSLWGVAPNPVHLFEKRWSQKLLMSMKLVRTQRSKVGFT
jgi:hypothetical protein